MQEQEKNCLFRVPRFPDPMSNPLPSRPPRNGSIDLIRWLGSLGIVLFHAHLPGEFVGYAALPMFVMLLVYYGHDSSLQERFLRLMTPFAIWSVVYGLALGANGYLSGRSMTEVYKPWMLLTGPALHLWFLPYGVAFLALTRRLTGAWMWGIGVSVSALALWAINTHSLPIPLAQWSYVTPAAFLGLAMARSGLGDRLLLLGAGLSLIIWGLGWSLLVPQLAIACVVTWLALRFPLRPTPLTNWMAATSLGVYIVHPLLLAVAVRLHLPDLALFAGIVIGAHLITMVLRRVAPATIR